MALIINKDMLGPAYDYLRATKPFSGWKLPPADEVVFKIVPHKGHCAHYIMRGDGRHEIGLSAHWHPRHVMLLSTMGHEMVHMRQEIAGLRTRAMHNADFWRCADRICKAHLEFERSEF